VTKWLGGNPELGYASVGQMPGAPGFNDAAIFGDRSKPLNEKQFATEPSGPAEEYDGMPVGWNGQPPTAEELGY
jgi:hypothetical protein